MRLVAISYVFYCKILTGFVASDFFVKKEEACFYSFLLYIFSLKKKKRKHVSISFRCDPSAGQIFISILFICTLLKCIASSTDWLLLLAFFFPLTTIETCCCCCQWWKWTTHLIALFFILQYFILALNKLKIILYEILNFLRTFFTNSFYF